MDIWRTKKIRGPRNIFYSIVQICLGGLVENFEKYLL